MLNKRLINTGEAAPAPLDPLQNFETVTYTGNGGTQKITGYIRKGAAFNVSSSFIDTNAKIPASLDFSVSFWMKSSDTSAGTHYIFGTKGNYATNGWFISNDAGYIRYGEGNGVDNATSQYSPSVVADGNWNHVVVTRAAGGTVNMYVNNSRVITDGSVGTYFMTSYTWAYDLHIGRYAASSILFYDGGLDQVRIFNTALNPTQVGQLALETYADPKKSTTDYFGDGSGVALYELDEDAGDSSVTQVSSVATYQLDGNANDLTGNYNGTWGGTEAYTTGQFGQAAVFNGSSRIIPATTPIPSSGAFTVSAWVKTSSSNSCFISFGDFWLKSEYLSGVFSLGDLNTSFQGTTDISDGNWHHCVLTVDASNNIVLYVDGSSEDTGTSTINRTNGGSFAIGVARTSNPVYYWNGNIDQIRIYDKALSADNVNTLYNESLANSSTNLTLDIEGLYNGTPTNVNFLGMAFQPDLVWVKNRSVAVNHYLYDSIRGTGAAKALHSNTTDSEASASVYSVNGGVQSIDSNGFTAFEGTDGTYQGTNKSGNNYVAWCWKAGGTAVSNTNGTITSQVSANTAAGFSIVNFTGTSSNVSVGHGLNATPELFIIKTLSTGNWFVYTTAIDGSLDFLVLNTTAAAGNASQSLPTSTVFYQNQTNASIAYCFHSVDGYQKVGSYSGGQTLYTDNIVDFGFTPRFVIVKNITAATGWLVIDSMRPNGYALFANDSGTEVNYSGHIKLSSNGLRFDGNNNNVNASGNNYIYLAIA